MQRRTPLGSEIHGLSNLLRRRAENTRPLQYVANITGANGWIISHLALNRDRDIFQRDIEKRFSITRSTASKVLSLMEQKGLITRQNVEYDQRLKKIVLTEKALALHEEIIQELDKMEAELLRGFTEKEIDQLYGYFARLKKNLT
jgi:DNA-binding MarR family transcriptional regulator